MASTHCVAVLSRFSTEMPHPRDGVTYRSHGTLRVVCDGHFDTTPLHEVGVPGPTVVLSAVQLPRGDVSDDMDVRYVQGRVTSLSGWLGEFTFELDHAPGKESPGISSGGKGKCDLVIDLSATPLIERSVLPPGYFAPRNSKELTLALEEARRLVGQFVKQRYFHYEPGLCAHSSFGQPGCTRCLDVCGADAIRSEGDRIGVEPHLCQGCAACTLACPTGALSFAGPTREQLLEQVEQAILSAGNANPTLVIHQPGLEWPALESHGCVALAVEPLAAFGEEIWLAALARGAGRIVLLVDDTVPEETRRLLEARLDIVRSMLDACGHAADAVSVVEGVVEAGALAAGSRVTNRSAGDSTDLLGASPLPAHHKRALMTRSLARLEPAHGFEPRKLDTGAPLGTIIVDQERCTLCSACVKLCPTAALRYTDSDESATARLAFAEELCVQCGVCESGCPEHAISLQARLASLPVRGFWRLLSSEPLASCVDCGRGFMPRKLLEINLHKAEVAGMPVAAGEQMKRCPGCRQQRLSRS